MSPKEEQHYLQGMLRSMDGDDLGVITSKWLPWAAWPLLFVSIFLVLHFQRQLGTEVTGGLACLLGVVAGVGMFWHVSAARWPYVRHHLNRESIERRLRELQA